MGGVVKMPVGARIDRGGGRGNAEVEEVPNMLDMEEE